MGIFGKGGINIGSAKVGKGGVYFREGEYDITVNAVKAIQPRSGGLSIVVETTVDTSTNTLLKPGASCTHFISMSNPDVGPANFKRFIAEMMELDSDDDEQEWDALAEAVVADDNPLGGRKAHLSVFRSVKKAYKGDDDALEDPKKSYLAYRYTPIDSE